MCMNLHIEHVNVYNYHSEFPMIARLRDCSDLDITHRRTTDLVEGFLRLGESEFVVDGLLGRGEVAAACW